MPQPWAWPDHFCGIQPSADFKLPPNTTGHEIQPPSHARRSSTRRKLLPHSAIALPNPFCRSAIPSPARPFVLGRNSPPSPRWNSTLANRPRPRHPAAHLDHREWFPVAHKHAGLNSPRPRPHLAHDAPTTFSAPVRGHAHRSSPVLIWVDRPQPWVDYPVRLDRANRLVVVCLWHHCYSAPTRPASAASRLDPIQSIHANRLVRRRLGPLISPRFHHADSVSRGPPLLPLSRRTQPIDRPHSPNRLPSRVEDFATSRHRLPFFGRHCRADSLLHHDPPGTPPRRLASIPLSKLITFRSVSFTFRSSRRKIKRDRDAPRKNRQNGGSPEPITRPTQHPQWFRRTRPRLTPRGVTMRNFLKIRPRRIRLPRDGNPRARDV